jgi:hypothetical protein
MDPLANDPERADEGLPGGENVCRVCQQREGSLETRCLRLRVDGRQA